MNLQARLIYRTDERLDQRCVHHFPIAADFRHLRVGARHIAIVDERSITMRTLDGRTLWSEPTDENAIFEPRFVEGDRFISTAAGALTLRDADGTVLWSTETDDIESFVVSDTGDRILALRGETGVAVYDIRTGKSLAEWDMAEDYDFGRGGPTILGLALIGDRAFVINGREITEWTPGGLERIVYRGGDNVSRWTTSSLFLVGDTIVEASPCDEERGVVAYDAATLEFLRQRPLYFDEAHVRDGRLVAWSNGGIAMWDPQADAFEFKGTDWASHSQLSVTVDGAYAVSLSPAGELCVFDVAAMPPIDGLPEEQPTARRVFNAAVLPDGEHLVFAEGDGASAGVSVLDRTGQLRRFDLELEHEFREFVPLDARTLCTVDGDYEDETAVRLWHIDDLTQTAHEVSHFFDMGPGWLRTRHDDDEREVLVVYELPNLDEGTAHEMPPELSIEEALPHPRRVVANDGDNEVLYDFADGVILEADSGKLSGNLYFVEGWNDDYDTVLTLWNLEDGESQEVEADTATTWVSGRQNAVYYDNYDGEMFVWQQGSEPRRFGTFEDIADFELSRDEAWITMRVGGDVMVFDAGNPTEPIARVTIPFHPDFLHCDRGLIIAGSSGGAIVVYALE